MEALELHTDAPELHWEDNTSCISVVEAKLLLLELNTFKFLSIFWLGPAQDVPFSLILWYVAKTI